VVSGELEENAWSLDKKSAYYTQNICRTEGRGAISHELFKTVRYEKMTQHWLPAE
jgi:hypothetical protein